LFNAKVFFQKTHGGNSCWQSKIFQVQRLSTELQSKKKKSMEKQLETEKKALKKKLKDSEKRYNMLLTKSLLP
jgi:hypothetical protein